MLQFPFYNSIRAEVFDTWVFGVDYYSNNIQQQIDIAWNNQPASAAPDVVDDICWPINHKQAKLFETSLPGK